MTNQQKIQATLSKLGEMCDDCLSTATMVKPRQSVNATCRSLQKQGALVRSQSACPRCRADKIVNRLRKDDYSASIVPALSESKEAAVNPAVVENEVPRNHDVEALSEDEIKKVLEDWLVSRGWRTKVAWARTPGIDIEATKGERRWVIEAKGPGSRPPMRVNYFLSILGETLQRMNDPDAHYSIALPDLPQYRGLWDRLPDLAKSRTRISILFVSLDGQVAEVFE